MNTLSEKKFNPDLWKPLGISINAPSDDARSHRPPKESYVIHTPEPGDEDYEGLSEVVKELLEETPLICKWR